jgi:transposase
MLPHKRLCVAVESVKSVPIVNVAPIPSAPADLQLIAQLKSRLYYAELKIRVLEERLRLMRIEKYGAGGEKLSHGQMELFELEPVVNDVLVEAESERAPLLRSTNRSYKHPGRHELPANLPRAERVLPCTPGQRICTRCGRETIVIGYEESSQLDVEPAKYFVLITKREKRACRSCEELGVVSAPLPPRIIEKCLASDRIVIDTVIGKYCNHTPASAEHDSGKRHRLGNQPSDFGRLGPQSRRVADPHGRRDEARVNQRTE